MTEKPSKTKEQLISDERAAEQSVVDAEIAFRLAEIHGPATAEKEALDNARTDSLRIRKEMVDGLAQWHTYDAEQEVLRLANEGR